MTSPKHIAIIMDGNGRWGIAKKNSRNYGHKKGLATVEKVIDAAIEHKIKYLTLYVFSTENWKRPVNEINYLLKLLNSYISKEINNLLKRDIRIKVLGNIKQFPKELKLKLSKVEKLTKNNKTIQINMALNYGSRQELVGSIKKLIKKKINISEKNIGKYLYTCGLPDPDILIRTGNTNRLSNFLLWQLQYSEIFFEKKLWPDFTAHDYNKILSKFRKTKRNFGNI